MTTVVAYMGLLLLTSMERLVEVRVSIRNARWAMDRGGVETGQSHYPWMVGLHTCFLLGCAAEVWFLERPFQPVLGGAMLLLAVLCQGLRWWCIRTLGPRWNTRVLVVPGLERVTEGPYRFIAHPNYVAVVLEGVALPMIHGAWITAGLFTVLNAVLLTVRIRVEERALLAAEGGAS